MRRGVKAIVGRIRARLFDLSAFMKELKLRMTGWYNAKHGRKGTLWEGRFKCALVEGNDTLEKVAAYIDLNRCGRGWWRIRWTTGGAATRRQWRGTGRRGRATTGRCAGCRVGGRRTGARRWRSIGCCCMRWGTSAMAADSRRRGQAQGRVHAGGYPAGVEGGRSTAAGGSLAVPGAVLLGRRGPRQREFREPFLRESEGVFWQPEKGRGPADAGSGVGRNALSPDARQRRSARVRIAVEAPSTICRYHARRDRNKQGQKQRSNSGRAGNYSSRVA